VGLETVDAEAPTSAQLYQLARVLVACAVLGDDRPSYIECVTSLESKAMQALLMAAIQQTLDARHDDAASQASTASPASLLSYQGSSSARSRRSRVSVDGTPSRDGFGQSPAHHPLQDITAAVTQGTPDSLRTPSKKSTSHSAGRSTRGTPLSRASRHEDSPSSILQSVAHASPDVAINRLARRCQRLQRNKV